MKLLEIFIRLQVCSLTIVHGGEILFHFLIDPILFYFIYFIAQVSSVGFIQF